jgi:hypothetical protein
VLSPFAVASVLPSGLRANAYTAVSELVRVANALRRATSHNRTVWSELAVARMVPSGLNYTVFAARVWPVRVARSRWPATSHNRTLSS